MLETLDLYVREQLLNGSPEWTADTIFVGATAIVAAITYYAVKYILRWIEKLISRSETTWDDDLLNNAMLSALAQIAPALVVNWLLPTFFDAGSAIHQWIKTLTSLYILWAVVRIVAIFLSNLYDALARRENTKAYAIKGIFQMLKLVAIGIGVIIGLSILIGRQPGAILTAIGASAAVLMLVFKDTILGLVASIQLSANKMVKRGDWISVPANNADGEVIDVSLTTVKVRNWDNSVSTIPPYSLVSDSFRNYEAMRLSGGRRVDRSILIDVNTIRHCSPDELTRLADGGFLDGLDIDISRPVVNLRLMRMWIEHYLADHPRVNHAMTCMVRQMPVTPAGLPVQLYFFTDTTEWIPFEHIQSDILDEIYAVINTFGLRLFQSPAGTDIHTLAGKC